MQYVFPVIFGAMALVYLWILIRDYQNNKYDALSFWDHLWAAGKKSATKFWARMVGMASTLLGVAVTVTDKLDMTQVSNILKDYFDPQIVLLCFLVVGAVIEAARNRRGGIGK